MISRLKQTVQTFAIVLLAYFAYSLIAAPLIEPDVEIVQEEWEPSSRSGISHADLTLFPPGAWEHNQPKVLVTSQGTLLFDDYQQMENGDLRLPRCTLISYIDPPQQSDPAQEHGPAADGAERPSPAANPPENAQQNPAKDRGQTPGQGQRRPVVMRASEGAVLTFDSPPNFLMGNFSRLVGGQLLGDVTIFSPASSSTEDDALDISTKNIQIDQKRIWAPSEVSFRFGRSLARGRDLSIHLQPSRGLGGDRQTAMGSIRSLELEHVDHVDLQFEGDLFALTAGKPRQALQPTKSANEPPARRPATPIEIKCQGPFRFDFDALIASLEERVDVIRHNPDGPSDQLNCELLEIHLMPRDAGGEASTPPGAEMPPAIARPAAMQPKKIIAVGFPVIIRAPSMQAGARAMRMEYDFTSRRVKLSGDEPATLFRDQYFVEAPRLEYELLEGGRVGRMEADGPGLARGQLGKEKRPFEANWTGSVTLLPQGPHKVLSLLGRSSLAMAGLASMKADQAHLYLVEVPRPGSDQVDIHADRMQASGNIEWDSPELIAFLAEAQLWFRQLTPAQIADAQIADAQIADTQTAAAQADATAGRRDPGLLGHKTGPGTGRPTKMLLTAGSLRGQIVLADTPQLESLDLQNNVHLSEFQPVAKSSLDIAAQRVVLEHGNTPTAELTLTGAPARFSAEGMTLDGGLVRVQMAGNLARVEGPGSMLMLPQHAALGENGRAKPLSVHWKQGMSFDGLVARFQGDIETRGGHLTKDQETIEFVAAGNSLEAELNRRIKFSDPATTDVEASRLSFPGPARIDSRTVDPQGRVISIDSVSVQNLVLDRQSGRLTGQGPGQVIHRGPNPEHEEDPPAGRQVAELIFLRVDFENEMVGNLDRREIEFLNGTRTIFGPISDWQQSLDPQRPDLLGEDSVIVASRRLAVADMRAAVARQPAIEVEATGNAQIQGRRFRAAGERVSYIQAKDQLVIEGDGRIKSTLKFQRPGGSAWQTLNANKILYYPRSGQFALDSFELELNTSQN